jgi:hypothetical protein
VTLRLRLRPQEQVVEMSISRAGGQEAEGRGHRASRRPLPGRLAALQWQANHKRQGLLAASIMQAEWRDKSRYMSRPCPVQFQTCSVLSQRFDGLLRVAGGRQTGRLTPQNLNSYLSGARGSAIGDQGPNNIAIGSIKCSVKLPVAIQLNGSRENLSQS